MRQELLFVVGLSELDQECVQQLFCYSLLFMRNKKRVYFTLAILFQQLGWIASGFSIKLDKTVVILLTEVEESNVVFDRAKLGVSKVFLRSNSGFLRFF